MKNVKFGIVGLGNMGSAHAKALLSNQVPRAILAAVCDENPKKLESFENIKKFSSSDDLIASGEVDAILVATPHYSHTTIGVAALKAGIHTLLEKPISVHKADCERLIAAHTDPSVIFGAMFNQRTDQYYQKIRNLIQSGELGQIRRVNWIITNWFRTEAYYASGGWRATWKGEGGGVLLNQCPHNIDLFQWMFGMPSKVRAHASLGRYHNIEVEDDVTAYFEYPDGTTAVFITSTGEAPGTNRLEITAERGRLVYENDQISYLRNEQEMSEFSSTTKQWFSTPEKWIIEVPAAGHGGQHNEIIRNFTDAILDGTPLLAPGAEGIHSVELANSMLFSALGDRTVNLPLDALEYEAFLKKLIDESSFEKTEALQAEMDLSKSF